MLGRLENRVFQSDRDRRKKANHFGEINYVRSEFTLLAPKRLSESESEKKYKPYLQSSRRTQRQKQNNALK